MQSLSKEGSWRRRGKEACKEVSWGSQRRGTEISWWPQRQGKWVRTELSWWSQRRGTEISWWSQRLTCRVPKGIQKKKVRQFFCYFFLCKTTNIHLCLFFFQSGTKQIQLLNWLFVHETVWTVRSQTTWSAVALLLHERRLDGGMMLLIFLVAPLQKHGTISQSSLPQECLCRTMVVGVRRLISVIGR